MSDVIRKDRLRGSKVLTTFGNTSHARGHHRTEASRLRHVLVVLLRSLPEAVKNYILHHSSADTYESSYRNAAMRWEEQHRLFNDFEVSGKKMNALESSSKREYRVLFRRRMGRRHSS